MTTRHPYRNTLRRTATAAVLAAVLTLATGCADEPPAGHEERLNKAAGVAAFKITCTQDLWDRTKPSKSVSLDSHEDAKPRKVDGPAGERGLVEITLTGGQLVDYLKTLEEDVSGGFFANSSAEQLSRRMYDAIAPVVDRIEKGKPPTEVPQAIVDDAAGLTDPTPSKSAAKS
ncbi:hypothetical protein R6L23_01135 [Streptomyces sp. SR27]|uniref:hypothetical protein n=1 Tax=Streptomyces sp. SR27 TaxID=3076630 RepID=UPI00295B2A3D|nr:hypothetical protein [Streptomyces sp. SR27]MDV9186850.1 hypothetical protein [Streptomyces sp. SR27]